MNYECSEGGCVCVQCWGLYALALVLLLLFFKLCICRCWFAAIVHITFLLLPPFFTYWGSLFYIHGFSNDTLEMARTHNIGVFYMLCSLLKPSQLLKSPVCKYSICMENIFDYYSIWLFNLFADLPLRHIQIHATARNLLNHFPSSGFIVPVQAADFATLHFGDKFICGSSSQADVKY